MHRLAKQVALSLVERHIPAQVDWPGLAHEEIEESLLNVRKRAWLGCFEVLKLVKRQPQRVAGLDDRTDGNQVEEGCCRTPKDPEMERLIERVKRLKAEMIADMSAEE